MTYKTTGHIIPGMETMAKTPRGEEKRRLLLARGAVMLMEKGYHGTGIQEVVDSVKVPKGSFYNYFDSKEHFAREVIRFSAALTMDELDAQLARDDVEALQLIAECFERQGCHCEESEFREGCIFGNLAAEVAESSEVCRHAAAEAMEAMGRKYRDVLARGQREGTVRSDVSAGELAELLVNAWEGAVLRMKVVKSKRPLEQVVGLLMGKFFRPADER